MTQPTDQPRHLWEIDHPYYCNEGNYFSNDCHTVYDSWADFFDCEGDADPDYNLVYRWDWKRPDIDDGDDPNTPQRLFVFWMGQRKALARSTECQVAPDDEPAVRAWLEERAKTLIAIWAPISLAPPIAGEAS